MFYYLYALERVGRLSGRRFIGDHDWYREGADYLIGSQDEFHRFWSNVGPMENSNVATSFALLFLSKGNDRWLPEGSSTKVRVRKPSGTSTRMDYASSCGMLKRLGPGSCLADDRCKCSELEDLLQAPVLVMSGTEAFQLTAQVAELLKEYVDQGGCILFEAEGGDACGDASGFERSVNQLCQNWFEGAGLERLPPGHPIWSAQHKVDPTLLGPDFGFMACRRVVGLQCFMYPKACPVVGSTATFFFTGIEVRKH